MDTKPYLCIGTRADNLSNPVVIPNIGRILKNEVIWLYENILYPPDQFVIRIHLLDFLKWVNTAHRFILRLTIVTLCIL